jgi:hypothetical protein
MRVLAARLEPAASALVLCASLCRRGNRCSRNRCRGSRGHRRRPYPGLRSDRLTDIVKLNAAVAAMVQVRTPKLLYEIEKPFVHGVDLVPRRQARQPVCAAARAARIISQVERIPAWFRLSSVTKIALEHAHIKELFTKSSMDAAQSSVASGTVEHFVIFYTPIA